MLGSGPERQSHWFVRPNLLPLRSDSRRFTVASIHTYMSSSNGRDSKASGNWGPAQTYLHRRLACRKVRIWVTNIRGVADKSLARPSSPCRRTESIVSLERGGLFMCRIASIFLLQRLKGNMSDDARDFNNIETRAVIKFFSCKPRRRRNFTPFWQKH